MEFLGLPLYPWKFFTIESFTPVNPVTHCVTALGNFNSKNEDLLYEN